MIPSGAQACRWKSRLEEEQKLRWRFQVGAGSAPQGERTEDGETLGAVTKERDTPTPGWQPSRLTRAWWSGDEARARPTAIRTLPEARSVFRLVEGAAPAFELTARLCALARTARRDGFGE